MYDADIAIIGGGTSGCVLAARLSEQRSIRVLLIEAGPDTPPGAVPADIEDLFPRSYANTAYFWPNLQAQLTRNSAPRDYSQARVMGGGSSVMGMWAVRGLPADYDGWVNAGATGWSYNDVLPFFEKLETDIDHPMSPHGTHGPTPIRRIPRELWPGFNEALAHAAADRGLPFRQDLNTSFEDGVFAIPKSASLAKRASAASEYLTLEVRRRANLQILADSQATSIDFDGGRATGVAFRRGNAEFKASAQIVILAAGAIHSPAVLMRSGIGPADDLARLGIKPKLDLKGVGRNLQNHVFAHLGAVIRPQARQSPSVRSYAISGARVSSPLEGAPSSDLFLSFMARTGSRRTGNRIGMVGAHLYAPYSRGRVVLASGDALQPPRIDFSFLEDVRDKARLLYIAALAREMLEDRRVRSVTRETFILPANPPIRELNRPGARSAMVSNAMAALLGLNALARRTVLEIGIGRNRLLDGLSSEAFNERVIESATAMFHPVGTCSIGSVVDHRTKVIGSENLYVIDASIMPVIPRANTNIPTMMVAERGASLILGSR